MSKQRKLKFATLAGKVRNMMLTEQKIPAIRVILENTNYTSEEAHRFADYCRKYGEMDFKAYWLTHHWCVFCKIEAGLCPCDTYSDSEPKTIDEIAAEFRAPAATGIDRGTLGPYQVVFLDWLDWFRTLRPSEQLDAILHMQSQPKS
jgi:hypothetical protein